MDAGLSYDQRQEILQGFLEAAARGDVPELQKMVASGVDVNTQGWEGETGVIQAVYYGKAAAITALAGLGADLELKENQQHTALMLAAQRNDVQAARALVDGGADVYALHASGRTARQLAVAQDGGKGEYHDMIDFLAQAEKDAPQRAAQRAVVAQRPFRVGRPLAYRKAAP